MRVKISKRIRDLIRGQIGGYRLSDIWLSAIGNPVLIVQGIRHVANRHARAVESRITASKNSHLRAVGKVELISPEALIQDLSNEFGVIQLKSDGRVFSIGVADVNFFSALIFLKFRTHDSQIQIKGRNVNFGTELFKRRPLSAPCVEIHWVGPDLRQKVISIEPYFRHETGIWLSNNTRNKVLRAVRSNCLEAPSLTIAKDLLGAQTLASKSEERKIDAVYTWVDHTDPEWVALHEREGGGACNSTTDTKSLARFHNNNELKFSLRSLHQNAPWINKIYVVTNCGEPLWLKQGHSDIIWIDHTEILPDWALPTFNSHVIESALHKIPDLSEHFIYFNDDVFLARSLTKDFFFDPNGVSKSFLEGYGMVSGEVTVGDADYLNASRNASRLLQKAYDIAATQLHQHSGFALRRSVLAEIEDLWSDEFKKLRRNKFRTENDINVTSFLYHHYAIITGHAREADTNCVLVKALDIRWRTKLREIDQHKCDAFCINEGGTLEPASDWHPAVAEFLQNRFPEPGPWEK